jgi:uncharacterized phage protein gp47/JayE
MQLQLQTFSALVESAAAAVQGAARQLLDLTVGSTLRAILEANASVGLWMQWLILQVLQMTRAATSSGGDLDSWMADFGLARLPGVAAVGSVTFSRFVPFAAALVPAGTEVRTADGSQSFLVIADPTNAAWQAAQNGYLLGAEQSSVTVPVAAMVTGSAGNVQPGTITLIVAALPGIDTVNNAAALARGEDAEPDAAFRLRFQNFINSRSRATEAAVTYAVTSVRQGLVCKIAENQLPDGSAGAGIFTVVVDDGTGAPSASLLSTVSAAVEAVRPLGSIFSVQGPTITPATIALTVEVADANATAAAQQAVSAAVSGYVNTLAVGTPLAWSRVLQVAYSASTEIVNVKNVLVNGGQSDLDPGNFGVVKATSVTVS